MEIRMDDLRFELLGARACGVAFSACPCNPGSWKESAYVSEEDVGHGSLPLSLCLDVTLRRAISRGLFGSLQFPSDATAAKIFDMIGMTTGLHERATAHYDVSTSIDSQDGVRIEAIVMSKDDVVELHLSLSKMVPVPDDDAWFDSKMGTHAGLITTGKKLVEMAEVFAGRGVRAMEVAYGKVWP